MKIPSTWCRWSALNSLTVDGKKRQDFCVLKSLNWHVMLTKDIPSHAQNTAFFPPLWMPPAKCCGWPQTAFELRLYEWGGCKRQKQLQAEKERGREGRIGGQKVWWWERERKPQRFLAPILLFNLNCCGSSEASEKGGEERFTQKRNIRMWVWKWAWAWCSKSVGNIRSCEWSPCNVGGPVICGVCVTCELHCQRRRRRDSAAS